MFQVDPNVQKELQGSLTNNQSVKLPFGAPQMWWSNGKPALLSVNEIQDARRFGGFGVSREDVEAQAGQIPAELPYNWKLFDDLTNTKGATYSAYLSRTAWVAPIARRYRWMSFEGKNKSQVEYLCYLAVMEQNKTLNPWGAVVISGSSYSGSAIDNAIKEFAQKTASIRGGVSQNFFFHPLGTWGNSPKPEERKGKNGSSSLITPCQLYVPENGYTEETLQKWFVPQEYHAELADLLRKSKDWLADWAKKDQPEQQDVNAVLESAEEAYP